MACMLMRGTELRRSRGDKEMKIKEDIQFKQLQTLELQ